MIVKALQLIRPGAEWSMLGDSINWIEVVDSDGQFTGEYDASNLVWYDLNQTKPTKTEIENALTVVEQAAISDAHQRLRAPEYPPLADLADALYHQSKGDNTKMEAYLAACEAVKQKYPKGSE